MRRVTVISVVCLGLAAGPAFAGLRSGDDPPAASSSPSSVEKAYEGKVTEFASGRLLTIAMEGEKTQTFRLDAENVSAVVDPGIAVGSRVRVVEKSDPAGKRIVTVKLAETAARSR